MDRLFKDASGLHAQLWACQSGGSAGERIDD
jgi:hypothetical protein